MEQILTVFCENFFILDFSSSHSSTEKTFDNKEKFSFVSFSYRRGEDYDEE